VVALQDQLLNTVYCGGGGAIIQLAAGKDINGKYHKVKTETKL
jgi:hypothetical protein